VEIRFFTLRRIWRSRDCRANILTSRRTLIKTQDYLDVFARFKQKENIEAVERMLATHDELEYFERSQLGLRYCLFYEVTGG